MAKQQQLGRLILLDAIARLDTSKPLPDRLVIFPDGTHETRDYGKLTVNHTTALTLSAVQKAIRREQIHGDFEHNSIPSSPTYKGEPVHLSATRARVAYEPGVGIVALSAEWTEEANAHKADYPEISPAVLVNNAGEVIGLDSFALCRHGQIRGLAMPLSAETTAALKTCAAELHVHLPGDDAEADETEEMKFLPRLRAALGLSDDTPEEKVWAAANAAPLITLAALNKNPNQEKAMDYKKLLLTLCALPDTATDNQITDQVNKLASKLAALIGMDLTTLAAMPQRVTEIAMQLETAHRANLIQLAASQGKVVPASALPGKDGKGGMAIPALETLISELPATVPVEQRTPMGAALVALTAGAGTVADSEPPPVAKQAGITKEQWQADGKKYGRG